ncbi:MAG: ribonuclease III [Acidimicrobiia bacterium]|nr:MAG: ribonuclease III [Acidimicrobiia bacterium]
MAESRGDGDEALGEGRRPVPVGRLERALGHRFADRSLLHRALTHPSMSAEMPGEESNQRLEFLGDAVLDLVVAATLHRDWDLPEGSMSKVRAAVVDEGTLAEVARGIGVDGAIRLGKGEEASGGRNKDPILSDSMEAIIGAVFLDAGFEAAAAVVERLWAPQISIRVEAPGEPDHKTRLQEMLARQGLAPRYEVSGTGPAHRRTFTATVWLSGRPLGTGVGTSKKRAQQEAALAALEVLEAGDA